MASHNVKFTLPERPLGKEDIEINIYRNKMKLGEIRISKGGIDYYPSRKKNAISIKWYQFNNMMLEWQERKRK